MVKNYLKMQFYSYPRNQAFARDAVAAFCLELNPSLSDLSDVKTAVSEAVTNCTVHAYGDGAGLVTVECEIEGDKLHIKISDSGRGIDDVQKAVQPFRRAQRYGIYHNADLHGRIFRKFRQGRGHGRLHVKIL